MQDRKNVLKQSLEDDQRRFEQFKYVIADKKWLDIGTGVGGILDLMSTIAKVTKAVEPQKNVRDF